MATADTLPEGDRSETGQNAPRVVVAAEVLAEDGSLYVHKDLVQVVKPWAVEEHVGPPATVEKFGDVESWATYVKRFGTAEDPESDGPLVTWNSQGLRATLDYHTLTDSGRLQWKAEYPFPFSPEYRAWFGLADGHAKGQRQIVEALEDRAAGVVEPAQAELLDLLRDLRGSVNAEAEARWNEDGTTDVAYKRKEAVRSSKNGGSLVLPPTFTIAIPILKGHLTNDNPPVAVVYRLVVRLRVTLDDNAHPLFRLSIPNLESTLENVFADRVAAARALLGDGFSLLRAAG